VTSYTHAHLLPDGRRFEHGHRVEEMPLADHEALALAEAHPELAGVEQAPAPGSPEAMMQRAAELRERAAWHWAQAGGV
jgi:hypothetical protein